MISAPQHKSKYKSNFEFQTFLKKKNQIFGFPCCSTREDLSIDASITNVGLILTKLWWFLFSGCGQADGQTDRHGFRILISSYGNMSAYKKFQLKATSPTIPTQDSGDTFLTPMELPSSICSTLWMLREVASNRMLIFWFLYYYFIHSS